MDHSLSKGVWPCEMTAAVFAAPKFDLPLKIQVDASQVGAGAILLSDKGVMDHPACFFSQKCNIHQRKKL